MIELLDAVARFKAALLESVAPICKPLLDWLTRVLEGRE